MESFFLCILASLRFSVELKWFLIALSVRPGNNLEISAHLLPCFLWASKMILSSSSDHLPFLMSGLRWLCHLSRHCLPIRPLSFDAMKLQFFAPYLVTRSKTVWSSSLVQGPFTSSGLRTFCQRCSHWTSDLFSKYWAIFFQLLAPNLPTRFFNFSSYSIKVRWVLNSKSLD